MDPNEEEGIDTLRVHVRRGLDRFCLGQYFTEYGLQETSVLIPEDASADDLEACGLTDKKCPFQIFLRAVAADIVKAKGITKGRKKHMKDYLEVLQAFAGDWVDYIRKNMRKKLQNKSNLSLMASPSYNEQKAKPSSTPDASRVLADSTLFSDKKKSGKRGPRGPYKKRKQKDASVALKSPLASDSTELKPNPGKKTERASADIETRRKAFEEEKEKVMKLVPEKNKRLFNQVGFAKWGRATLPAMALDPYQVPPGDIRDQWLKMFQNVVEKDRISKMGHLVWWIAPHTDGQSSYSVVPSNGFITYEEGAKSSLHELPPKIKKMIERGMELNKVQAETMESLRMLNALAIQPTEERQHPRSDFMEEDFWGLEDEEMEEAVEEVAPHGPADNYENDDDDDEELLDDEEDLEEWDSSKPVKKVKDKKRRKSEILEEDDEKTDYDDVEDVPPSPPPKSKKSKKAKLERGRKKKKRKKLLEGDEAMEADNLYDEPGASTTQELGGEQLKPAMAHLRDAGIADSKAVAAKIDANEAPSAAPIAAPLVDDVGMEVASASEDSAQADSDYGGQEFGEEPDALAEQDILRRKKTKKLKKKTPKSNDDIAVNDAREEVDTEIKKKKKKEKNKDKSTKTPKKRSKAAEQRELERCVEEYLPTIEELQMANEMKDFSLIQQVLVSMLPVAELFSASFFSTYDIPNIMKATKKVLLSDGKNDLSTYKKLWNIMKTSYQEKMLLMPDGFQARTRRDTKKDPEKASDDEQQQQLTMASATKDGIMTQQSTPAERQEPPVVSSSQDSSTEIAIEGNANIVASPATAVKKDDARRVSIGEGDQAPKTAEKGAPPKPKPKKFSVMDLVSKKTDNRRLSTGGTTDKTSSSATAGSATKRKTAPSWVTAPLPTAFDSFATCPRREDRLFAMEFLLQAAAHFPTDKGVNEESVARSLELAIYEWSESNAKWEECYWDKVHGVVAALTGKRDVGTLIGMIMDGHFTSPKSIAALSVENLEQSFEGRPLSISGE